jgi:hypothetical protein
MNRKGVVKVDIPRRTFLVSMLTVLMISSMAYCSLAEPLTGSNTAIIKEGEYKSFGVKGQGDFVFTVLVVNGSNVDVFICHSPPTLGNLRYLEGYDYIDVEYVEDSFPREDDDTMFIVVDNGDNVGVASTGDVEVLVEWETEKIPPPNENMPVLLKALGIAIVVALVIGILMVRVLRRREEPVDVVVETVYVDERGRAVPPPRSRGVSPKDRWCPRCGSERMVSPRTGQPYCPNCTPPPPPPPG